MLAARHESRPVRRGALVASDRRAQDPGEHEITINPQLLTDRLRGHLEEYLKELRDPSNTRARANFAAMYEHELPKK